MSDKNNLTAIYRKFVIVNNKKISISLPKPCDENWDTMTPADKGRHCAQCCKTVVDFTLLSDGEILDIFKKAKDLFINAEVDDNEIMSQETKRLILCISYLEYLTKEIQNHIAIEEIGIILSL